MRNLFFVMLTSAGAEAFAPAVLSRELALNRVDLDLRLSGLYDVQWSAEKYPNGFLRIESHRFWNVAHLGKSEYKNSFRISCDPRKIWQYLGKRNLHSLLLARDGLTNERDAVNFFVAAMLVLQKSQDVITEGKKMQKLGKALDHKHELWNQAHKDLKGKRREKKWREFGEEALREFDLAQHQVVIDVGCSRIERESAYTLSEALSNEMFTKICDAGLRAIAAAMKIPVVRMQSLGNELHDALTRHKTLNLTGTLSIEEVDPFVDQYIFEELSAQVDKEKQAGNYEFAEAIEEDVFHAQAGSVGGLSSHDFDLMQSLLANH